MFSIRACFQLVTHGSRPFQNSIFETMQHYYFVFYASLEDIHGQQCQ